MLRVPETRADSQQHGGQEGALPLVAHPRHRGVDRGASSRSETIWSMYDVVGLSNLAARGQDPFIIGLSVSLFRPPHPPPGRGPAAASRIEPTAASW